MIKPNCWKLRDYLESILEWTQENENKSPLFYYFSITSTDIEEQMDFVKQGFEKGTPVINLLWMMLDYKRNKK